MTTAIVTEIARPLEAVTHDTFIDDLGRFRAVARRAYAPTAKGGDPMRVAIASPRSPWRRRSSRAALKASAPAAPVPRTARARRLALGTDRTTD